MKKGEKNQWVAMNCRRLRLQHHKPQRYMADLLCITVQSYNRKEKMIIGFYPDEIETIANHFHTTSQRMHEKCVMPVEKPRWSIYKDKEASKRASKIKSTIYKLNQELKALEWCEENKEEFW